MNTKETVQTLMDAIQSGDFEKAKSLFADDFKFSGPVPEPINGQAWLGMSASLRNAFPNLDYQFKIDSVEGDTAHISAQLKGTHTGDLDLTAMDMGVIPATGKSFNAAHEKGVARLRDGKISAWEMEGTEGAGLMAILGQLGVKAPNM